MKVKNLTNQQYETLKRYLAQIVLCILFLTISLFTLTKVRNIFSGQRGQSFRIFMECFIIKY